MMKNKGRLTYINLNLLLLFNFNETLMDTRKTLASYKYKLLQSPSGKICNLRWTRPPFSFKKQSCPSAFSYLQHVN